MDKWIIIGIIILGIGSTIFAISWEIRHPCIKSHQQLIHHAAYTNYITHYINGHSILLPQYQRAYDTIETVCDKYK